MPPKTVTCSVCKSNVLKAHTYHIGGGKRACKTHNGVTSQMQQLRKSELERVKNKTMAAGSFQFVSKQQLKNRVAGNNPLESHNRHVQVALDTWNRSVCWGCKITGIDMSVLWNRITNRYNELVQHGSDKDMIVKTLKDEFREQKQIPLRNINLMIDGQKRARLASDFAENWNTFQRETVPYRMQQMITVARAKEMLESFGYVRLCPHCAGGYGLEFFHNAITKKAEFKKVLEALV